MHKVGGELRDVGPARAGRRERLLDLRVYGGALLVEAIAGGDHARDVERLPALHARDVRIGADGLAQGFDVVDLGHHFSRDLGLPRAASCALTVAISSARRTGLAW